MARATLVGPSAAGEILGRSAQYVHFLGKSGKLKPARTRPTMRFRLTDVIAASDLFPKNMNETRGRHPKTSDSDALIREILS